jgi:hypothetical protein
MRTLSPRTLADPRLYFARRNLLKAYQHLAAPASLDDLGYSRAFAVDAVDLLSELLNL